MVQKKHSSLRLLLPILVALLPHLVQGQTQHNPFYDVQKKVHFGFSTGTNFSDVKYQFSDEWYNNDTVSRVNIGLIPGITLGAICNFHIKERMDIRIIPSLLLTQRNVDFTFRDGSVANKTIESVYADIPVLLKYKSDRIGNWRFYTLGGFEYAYDISANEGDQKDFFDPNISYRHNNFFWCYGFGFDLYFPYFKFSPEIRISNGINNILDPHPSVYSDSFSQLRNRMIVISMQFE